MCSYDVVGEESLTANAPMFRGFTQEVQVFSGLVEQVGARLGQAIKLESELVSLELDRE